VENRKTKKAALQFEGDISILIKDLDFALSHLVRNSGKKRR
jgi:hypothetical protein